MGSTFTFTIESINKLQPREDLKPYRVKDSKVQCLTCAISGKGAKSLAFFKKWKGKLETEVICKWGDGVSIADAREIASRYMAKLANGESIKEKSKAERECLTLKDCFEEYKVRANAKGNRSTAYTEKKFNLYLKPLHNKSLLSISANDISAITRKLAKDGFTTTANRVRTLVSTLYNLAIEKLEYSGRNICTMVEIYPEEKKEMFLTKDQLKDLIKFADEEGQPYSAVVKLLVYTGLRIENVLQMSFNWVDFNNSTITIPSESYKTKKKLVIPISPNALQVIQERRSIVGADETYVFPRFGTRTGSRPYMSYPKNVWNRLKKKMGAGFEKLTPHQCRHSFCSLLLASGCNLERASKLMGHNSIKTTERYSHLLLEDLRKEVDGAMQVFE